MLCSALLWAVATSSSANAAGEMRVALDGNCAVCLVDHGHWNKGTAEYASKFDGQTYLFPSDGIKAAFDANPIKYAPVLGGDCIVCFAKAGKRVPGSVKFTSTYQGRVYLFPSAGEKQAFDAAPQSFANADLALNGECAVCLAKNHHVPGTPQFTAVHNGLRFQFPGQGELDEFQRDAAGYVKKLQDKKLMSAVEEPAGALAELITATGTTSCAACSHGVHPLRDPDQLGLAVSTPDGRLFVVEGAHAQFPQLYADRFQGKKVKVTGRVIETRGNVSWVEPQIVTALN